MVKIIAIIFMFTAHIVYAGTFYVNSSDPKANDKSPGTKNAPWKTIQNAGDKAEPGDEILVFPGSYDRTVIHKSGEKGKIITIKGINPPGTKHVIFNETLDPLKPKAFPGDTKNNAVSKGFEIRADFVRIENFEVTEIKGKGAFLIGKCSNAEIVNNFLHDINPAVKNWGGVRPEGHNNSNILIKDNIFFRVAGTIIEMAGKNWIVEGNEISHGINFNTSTGEFVGGEDAIRPFGSGHIIRRNYLHNFLEEEQFPKSNPHIDAFQVFSVSPASQYSYDILIENNYCYNIGQMFMATDGNELKGKENVIHHITFRNNIFRKAHFLAFHIIQCVDYFTFENNVVADGWYIAIYFKDRSHHAAVRNNIFYNNSRAALDSKKPSKPAGQMGFPEDCRPGSVWDYNLHNFDFTNPPKNKEFGRYDMFGVDPKFVDPEKGDYRLQKNSPAIGAGDPSMTLPGGKRPDMGAAQFGGPDENWFLKWLQK